MATLAAVGIMVVLALMVFGGGGTSTSVSATTSRSTQQPIIPSNWLDAVCQLGTTISIRSGLPNADLGTGACKASNGYPPGSWISIGQYSSEYMARDDAARYRQYASTAISPDTGGWALFVNFSDKTGASLQPLAQFGFTITPTGTNQQR